MKRKTVSRKEARKLAPDYVAFIEGDWDKLSIVSDAVDNVKRGQKVITFADGVFIIAKVTSVRRDCFEALDGPVVRVGDGEWTWRIDGDKYAFPIPEEDEED